MVRAALWSLASASLVHCTVAAQAHEWYPSACCNERDCRPLFEALGETVVETAQGWRLWDGRTITRRSAQPSPDQKFHLCETRAKSILCFFAPPGSS